MNYLLLVYEFIKTGLFSIGGGLATMPFLYAMADKYPWFTRTLLVDMIAISESTPGPIGINMATYAGYAAAGISGGIVASLAIITPSIIIVSGVVRVLDRFKESRMVKNAFYGLRPAVTALIAWAGLGITTYTVINLDAFPDILHVINIKQFVLYILLLLAARLYKKTQPVYLIAAAAMIGALLQF